MSDEQYVTFLALAKFRGAKADEDGGINGGEFVRVGLDIMGGCQVCGATLAAYNGYPSKSGFWRCKDCLYDEGWTDVAQVNADIFGDADLEPQHVDDMNVDPEGDSDV